MIGNADSTGWTGPYLELIGLLEQGAPEDGPRAWDPIDFGWIRRCVPDRRERASEVGRRSDGGASDRGGNRHRSAGSEVPCASSPVPRSQPPVPRSRVMRFWAPQSL